MTQEGKVPKMTVKVLVETDYIDGQGTTRKTDTDIFHQVIDFNEFVVKNIVVAVNELPLPLLSKIQPLTMASFYDPALTPRPLPTK